MIQSVLRLQGVTDDGSVVFDCSRPNVLRDQATAADQWREFLCFTAFKTRYLFQGIAGQIKPTRRFCPEKKTGIILIPEDVVDTDLRKIPASGRTTVQPV